MQPLMGVSFLLSIRETMQFYTQSTCRSSKHKPVLRLPKLHISEFRVLARAEMALADNQAEGARTWLEMWRQIEEDNPELLQWQMRIDGPDKLLGDLQKLLGRSQKKRGRL